MERNRRVLRQIVNAAGAVGVVSLLDFMGLSVTYGDDVVKECAALWRIENSLRQNPRLVHEV